MINNDEFLNSMSDDDAKEYLESIEADSYLSSAEFHDSKYL